MKARRHLARLASIWDEVPDACTVNERTARYTGIANYLTPESRHYLSSVKGRRVWFAWLWGWLIGINDASRHLVADAVTAEREACALTLEKEIAYLRKLQGATAPYVGTALTQTAIEVVEKMAATIRARGEEAK